MALPHLFSLPLFLALYFLENISLCQDQSSSKQFRTINSVHVSHIRYWQICEFTDCKPFGGDEFCQQTFPTEQHAVHRRRAPARQSQPELLLCCCRRTVNVTLSRNTSIPKNQATIFSVSLIICLFLSTYTLLFICLTRAPLVTCSGCALSSAQYSWHFFQQLPARNFLLSPNSRAQREVPCATLDSSGCMKNSQRVGRLDAGPPSAPSTTGQQDTLQYLKWYWRSTLKWLNPAPKFFWFYSRQWTLKSHYWHTLHLRVHACNPCFLEVPCPPNGLAPVFLKQCLFDTTESYLK